MAKTEEKKVTLEREYNVPLRRGWRNVPTYKRAKKAVAVLRKFIGRHMKSEDVKIGKYANMEVWARGIKHPPHHIKVKAVKYSDGSVMAEFLGAPQEKPKEAPKKVKSEKAEAPKSEKPAPKPKAEAKPKPAKQTAQ